MMDMPPMPVVNCDWRIVVVVVAVAVVRVVA